ncbi:pyridoxamine 5'-phosphate oxidase family protein [Actinomadura sp. KC06]|nr:pyridoxamine 5'-phosphate oxidase family protein [Actinomadura sp. KC06]
MRRLLDQGRFTTLATTDGTAPWASTVNFVPLRDPLRLVWYSMRDSQHSRNIETEPAVSGSIYLTGLPGFGLDGLQFEGRAHAVPSNQVEDIHDRYYRLNFPDEADRRAWILPVQEFHGDGPRRFYIAEITRLWLLDIDRWLHDKHDRRLEVPLTALT